MASTIRLLGSVKGIGTLSSVERESAIRQSIAEFGPEYKGIGGFATVMGDLLPGPRLLVSGDDQRFV